MVPEECEVNLPGPRMKSMACRFPDQGRARRRLPGCKRAFALRLQERRYSWRDSDRYATINQMATNVANT